MTTPHPWRARLARVWPVAKYVIGLVLAALVFEQLTGHKGELTEATVAIEGLHWGWVVLGVAAEAGSFLAFAQVQRRLLRAGKADVGIGPMAAITLAANSITNSLPAGSVIAPVYAFRQYRRQGADEAVAGWAVVATFVAASVTLGVMAAVGASIAGAEGASLDLVGVIVGVLLVSLAMLLVFLQKRALVWTVSSIVRLARRLTGWPQGELAAHIDQIIRRLTVVRLSPSQVVNVLWLGLANWLLRHLPLASGGHRGGLAGRADSGSYRGHMPRRLAWRGRRRPWPTSAPPGSAATSGTPDTGTDGGPAAAGHPGGDGDMPQAVGG